MSDLFDDAISSVSVVIATFAYVPHYGKWHPEVSEDERIALEKEIAREATLAHMRAIADARAAVARCIAHHPSLRRFLDEPVLYFREHADELIAELRHAQQDRREGGRQIEGG